MKSFALILSLLSLTVVRAIDLKLLNHINPENFKEYLSTDHDSHPWLLVVCFKHHWQCEENYLPYFKEQLMIPLSDMANLGYMDTYLWPNAEKLEEALGIVQYPSLVMIKGGKIMYKYAFDNTDLKLIKKFIKEDY